MSENLHFEATSSDEDSITFAVTDSDGGWNRTPGRFLAVSVSEEQAFDSYSHMVDCTFHMTLKQVRKLKDWLDENFPTV